MGCRGEGLDDLVSPMFKPNPETLEISTSDVAAGSSSDEVLPTMHSDFSAVVSRDLLRAILELLPPADLARAACVCRLWRAMASDRELLEGAFRAPWKVKEMLGEPSSPAFWRHPTLDRFAISHRLCRGDTVARLALRYSVQVMDIKRLNNMMSDHGIYSRERLLIPICNPELLHNSTCYIELDGHAKREVAVLYLEGGPDKKASYLVKRAITDSGRRKILDSVKRSMGVDDGTAEYYLSVSNGDPRAAMLQFSDDLRWERQMRGP